MTAPISSLIPGENKLSSPRVREIGPARTGGSPSHAGLLIVNADDWGRDRQTTDRILECVRAGAVSSTSAMVFMEDSSRAATIARAQGIDAGLHLNLTTRLSLSNCPARIAEHQERISRFLCSNRFSQIIFHPGLANSFNYVVAAQLDEFRRLYEKEPDRIDGHHHMHLCANVLMGKLLPPGVIVRRNFSFFPGEKNWVNRLYRRRIDNVLAARHRLTDYFFSLPPLEPASRLKRIFLLARTSVVEVETHPANPEERRFLAGGQIFQSLEGLSIAPRFALDTHRERT